MVNIFSERLLPDMIIVSFCFQLFWAFTVAPLAHIISFEIQEITSTKSISQMTSYLHGFIQLNATLENGNEFELTRGSPILRHALLGVVFGSVNISVCSQNS